MTFYFYTLAAQLSSDEKVEFARLLNYIMNGKRAQNFSDVDLLALYKTLGEIIRYGKEVDEQVARAYALKHHGYEPGKVFVSDIWITVGTVRIDLKKPLLLAKIKVAGDWNNLMKRKDIDKAAIQAVYQNHIRFFELYYRRQAVATCETLANIGSNFS